MKGAQTDWVTDLRSLSIPPPYISLYISPSLYLSFSLSLYIYIYIYIWMLERPTKAVCLHPSCMHLWDLYFPNPFIDCQDLNDRELWPEISHGIQKNTVADFIKDSQATNSKKKLMTDELPRLLNEQHCHSLIEALYNARLMEQHELNHIAHQRHALEASSGRPKKMQWDSQRLLAQLPSRQPPTPSSRSIPVWPWCSSTSSS